MAVYKVEDYLREAIDSVIAQDIGFEKIQLILVDDGSPDSSGAICDEYAARYPENIFVIHKENGGVSSARNAGLERASGRYINFMDSDDLIEKNVFSEVYRFFKTCEEETDIISVPILFFESKTGDHMLNYKFADGTRVIDLGQEWSAIQLHVNSAFFVKESLDGITFDTRLRYTEDSHFIQRVLLNKQKIGVVSTANYLYRVRSGSNLSALQISTKDPNWYLPRLNYCFKDLISTCFAKLGFVPKFVQYAIMYDLQWIFMDIVIPVDVLSTEENAAYINDILSILQQIDLDIILAQKNIKIETKLYVLSLKYGRAPDLKQRGGDLDIGFDGQYFYSVSRRQPIIEFISFDDKACTVEGFVSLFPLQGIEWEIIAALDGKPVSCEMELEDQYIFSLDTVVLSFYRFHVQIPLASVNKVSHMKLGVHANGDTIWFSGNKYGPFSGLTERYRYAYHKCGQWCVRNGADLVISKAAWYTGFINECLYLINLFFSRRHHMRKAFFNRLAYWFLRLIKRRPLWLISDRETHAGDNGEALFRYLIANHPEIDARFALLKGSPDYPSLLAYTGKVVPADSLKRKILYLVSDYVISSHAEWLDYRPFAPKDAPYRDIMADKRFVFLQHGVIKDDLSHWLRKSSKNIAGFVTSAYPEYESIVHGNYGYTEREVWLTGLPRFDRLISHEDSRQITIMPTWRKYLMGPPDEKTLMRELVPDFTSSRFFTFYNALLNDDRLLRAADEYGYTLAFFPHPNLQPHISIFHKNDSVLFLGADTAYRDVYASSALVVTDYSSAVFDFAYMRRPVIYAHFDREEFFGGGHVYTEGYFDYERDGFGEVEHDLDGTVERIIEYMANGCQMKDEYRARADRFFAFNDRNNCQRVYDKLMENR